MLKAVTIKTIDGVCDSWLAQPEGAGPWPGIIFCMDAVGPRANLKAMAERLASNGYVVLLPNLFYRERSAPIVSGVEFPAKASDIPKILEQIMPLVQRFDSEKALSDMHAFIEFLRSQTRARDGKLGIFGYCMGGAMAIRTAARYPDQFAAVASFHAGGLVTEEPESPHNLLAQINGALYVGHADQDPHMTAKQIQIFDEAMKAMTGVHESELYGGAHHHFTMGDLPAYDRESAEKHWQKLLELFAKFLN